MNHKAVFLILFWIFVIVMATIFICQLLRKYKAIEEIMNAPEASDEQR